MAYLTAMYGYHWIGLVNIFSPAVLMSFLSSGTVRLRKCVSKFSVKGVLIHPGDIL